MHRGEIHFEIAERTENSTVPFLYMFCIPGSDIYFHYLESLDQLLI